MEKRAVLIFIIILILASFVSLAQEGPEEGGSTGERELPEIQIEKQLPPGADLPSGAQGSAGPPITVQSADYYQDPHGVRYTDVQNAVLNPDGTIQSAGGLTLPNGAKVSVADGITSTGKDDYKINHVTELTQGAIILNNAQNVV